ncbi:MAG: hypothetical protein LBJ99_01480 [Oscillospiraceae bacterium]|nr:hypothetical protein [Oscillospiraceae bacterium]
MAILSPTLMVVFTFLAFRRGQKSDDTTTAREMGTILTEIGYIKSQMDGLNRKLEHYDERYTQFAERLSSVEQSTKSAHHRLDRITIGEAGE